MYVCIRGWVYKIRSCEHKLNLVTHFSSVVEYNNFYFVTGIENAGFVIGMKLIQLTMLLCIYCNQMHAYYQQVPRHDGAKC